MPGDRPWVRKCPALGPRKNCECPIPGTDNVSKCPAVARGDVHCWKWLMHKSDETKTSDGLIICYYYYFRKWWRLGGLGVYFLISAIPRQKTVTKIPLKKLGKCRRKIQNFLSTKSPSERQYASSFMYRMHKNARIKCACINRNMYEYDVICASLVSWGSNVRSW